MKKVIIVVIIQAIGQLGMVKLIEVTDLGLFI